MKHFVIALQGATVGKKFYEAGSIVGIHHNDSSAAQIKVWDLNKAVKPYSVKPYFAAIQSSEPLKKGDVRLDLVEQWHVQDRDNKAVATMKMVLLQEYGGHTLNAPRIAERLVDLKMTLEELRDSYEARARVAIEEDQRLEQERAETAARRVAVKGELAQAQRDEITYTFPAVRGIQAGREYYVAQVPYGVLAKLFVFDEEIVPAEHRAQRVLSHRRANDISDYMVSNLKDYVLPALTASASAEMAFEPVALPGASDRVGMLSIPMSATLLINDGQHRRKGIELALAQQPELAKETIAVTIYFDRGLERSQQMFADINARQVKPSSAINALYDRRNPFNGFVLSILDRLPKIKARVDFENATPGAKSHKLWSLVVIKKFVTLLTGCTEKNINDVDGPTRERFITVIERFFAECAQHIPQWSAMIENRVAASQVREEWVIGHAVWLEALGVFGQRLMVGASSADDVHWAAMQGLSSVDPLKTAQMWDGRCVVLGKMQKTSDGVKLTAAQLLKAAGLEMLGEMERLDQKLAV
ncbi:DNA sulfur modification protein DndB [Aquitalea palustris]|uniref:DNA sulfur modification protein DndB n=1 Tax=Aquitalea palustris TaxID=2480983 RepID=UPI001CF0B2A2|nr:DNA sulfur modification protein DndB [Aquitalea palustris]